MHVGVDQAGEDRAIRLMLLRQPLGHAIAGHDIRHRAVRHQDGVVDQDALRRRTRARLRWHTIHSFAVHVGEGDTSMDDLH